MTDDRLAVPLLLALLDGTTFANAIRRSGKPCRILLPDDPKSRTALVGAHLRGAPATLTFYADGHKPWPERVSAVALAALCPGEDGRCRWVGIDLDSADHGVTGLADPVHAARTIAERATAAGLISGLLMARSRRGRGRHVFLMLPGPIALTDAVIGVAALAAAAFKVAGSDVVLYGAQHAFRCANSAIACPGEPGAVELLPRSTVRPRHGWALALPAAGAFRVHGGGVIVDAFTDRPTHHGCVPRCDPESWSRFIEEARATLSMRNAATAPQRVKQRDNRTDRSCRSIDRIDPRTLAFLNGLAPEGTRNMSAFAASANLLGCGVEERNVERLILAGAAACGLPEREARAAFSSAAGALTRKRRRG